MSNKAADRLHRHIDKVVVLRHRQAWHDELDEALAAERRGVVERIRLEIRLSAFAANSRDKTSSFSSYREIMGILDAEVAEESSHFELINAVTGLVDRAHEHLGPVERCQLCRSEYERGRKARDRVAP